MLVNVDWKQKLSFNYFFRNLLLLVVFFALFLFIFELTAFLPIPGKWRLGLDNFYLELARHLVFVPTYRFPLSAYEYSYYDNSLSSTVSVGYGYINYLKFEETIPDGVTDIRSGAYDPIIKMTLGVRGRLLNRENNFVLENTNLDNITFGFYYPKGNIFLLPSRIFKEDQFLEVGRHFAKGKPLFVSFEFNFSDISEGDFIRYFLDDSGRVLRIDLIDSILYH